MVLLSRTRAHHGVYKWRPAIKERGGGVDVGEQGGGVLPGVLCLSCRVGRVTGSLISYSSIADYF